MGDEEWAVGKCVAKSGMYGVRRSPYWAGAAGGGMMGVIDDLPGEKGGYVSGGVTAGRCGWILSSVVIPRVGVCPARYIVTASCALTVPPDGEFANAVAPSETLVAATSCAVTT